MKPEQIVLILCVMLVASIIVMHICGKPSVPITSNDVDSEPTDND